jgi:hypothetical protein
MVEGRWRGACQGSFTARRDGLNDALCPPLTRHGASLRHHKGSFTARRDGGAEPPPRCTSDLGLVIEAPWLVNGGHGASFRPHKEDTDNLRTGSAAERGQGHSPLSRLGAPSAAGRALVCSHL